VAAKAAYMIRGKNKPTYEPSQETGDFFVGVDDDHEVPGLLGRLVRRLVLAAYHVGGLRGHAAEALALGVDHVPGALGELGLRRDEYGLHVSIPLPSIGMRSTRIVATRIFATRGRYIPIYSL
jgi:hypothetical protein